MDFFKKRGRVVSALALLASVSALVGVAVIGGPGVGGPREADQVDETTRTPPALPEAAAPSTPSAGEPWYAAYLDEDSRVPVFDGELNGIRIGPAVDPAVPCARGEAVGAPVNVSAGTAVEISPTYLPAQSTPGESGASTCRGEVILAYRTFAIASDLTALRYGGKLQIVRRLGEHQVPLQQAATRASATTIEGRPAVAFRPLTPEGWGPSALVIAEAWGTTTLQAVGFSAADLRRVAEWLYR